MRRTVRSSSVQMAERPRPAPGQRLQQIARGEAGVDDVLHQQDVLVLNRIVQILGDAHHAGRAPAVGPPKLEIARKSILTGMSMARASAVRKNTEPLSTPISFKIPPAILLADLRGHFADARGDLLLGEQDALDSGGGVTARSPQAASENCPCAGRI